MAIPDPTAAFGMAPTQLGGQVLSPEAISQWANYFAGGAGGGGTPVYGNQLVQTGTTYSPTIPWLTSGQASGMGLTGGQPGNTTQSLNLPWGALGISGSTPQALGNAINASPFAGANPADPYYNLILNQAGQGAQTPVYTQQQVQTGTTGSPYASMVGGQLFGNLTPEESSLLGFFNMTPNESYLLPNIINAIQASPTGNLPGGQMGLAQQQLQMAGFPNLNYQTGGYSDPSGRG